MIQISLRDGRSYICADMTDPATGKKVELEEFITDPPHRIRFMVDGHLWLILSKNVRTISQVLWERPKPPNTLSE